MSSYKKISRDLLQYSVFSGFFLGLAFCLVIFFFSIEMRIYKMENDQTIDYYENIDETKFLKFLNDGDIEKLQIVNREFAEVYIKKSELNNSNHQQKKLHQLGPHYKVEILDIKSFRELIIEHNQTNPENTIEFPNTSRNIEKQISSLGAIFWWSIFCVFPIFSTWFYRRKVSFLDYRSAFSVSCLTLLIGTLLYAIVLGFYDMKPFSLKGYIFSLPIPMAYSFLLATLLKKQN